MAKTTTINFRIEQHLKTQLIALAEEEHRSLGNYLENLIIKHLGEINEKSKMESQNINC